MWHGLLLARLVCVFGKHGTIKRNSSRDVAIATRAKKAFRVSRRRRIFMPSNRGSGSALERGLLLFSAVGVMLALGSCGGSCGLPCDGETPRFLSAMPASGPSSPIDLARAGSEQTITVGPQAIGLTISAAVDTTCVHVSPQSITFRSKTSSNTFSVSATGIPCALTPVRFYASGFHSATEYFGTPLKDLK